MNSLRRSMPLLGTFVDIFLEGTASREELFEVSTQAFDSVWGVHQLMSVHDSQSEISKLNQNAHVKGMQVHPWTWKVLNFAKTLGADSNGAFEPVVGNTLAHWGFRPQINGKSREPAPGSIQDVQLLPNHTVKYSRPLYLDLGGIAKGFAVDQAVAAIEAAGPFQGIVNAGGDLRVFGPNPQPITLRSPGRYRKQGPSIRLSQLALATSSTEFERKWHRGLRVTHLVNTRNAHKPVRSRDSVSVIADSCMIADACTKIGFLVCPEEFRSLLEKYEAGSFILRRNSRIEVIREPSDNVLHFKHPTSKCPKTLSA